MQNPRGEGQPEDAFEEIHHRQLRDIVRRVRSESRLEIYSTLRERVVRNPVYERRELSDFLEDAGDDESLHLDAC